MLYGFSDFLYVLVYYVIGYRKKIVRMNLQNSFPNKSEVELKLLEKKFYKHLTDLILETIKGSNISKKQLEKRCVNLDKKLYDDLLAKKKNAMVVMSHNGNWEWVCQVADLTVTQEAICVYKTLSDKHFDKWIYKLRSKFGTKPYPMEKTMRVMLEHSEIPTVIAIIGDQNPANTKNCHWTTFLNQETAFLPGTERIGTKLNWAIVYLKMRKVKRGYYECTTEMLFENPETTKPGEISEKIARVTEEDILGQPENWLWSHRRWKHKRA